MKGNSSVFTSTEAPPHLPILPHTEMTYWPRPPDLLVFQCKSIESSNIEEGGETVIFDNKAAAAELDKDFLEKLEKGCIFKRYYPGKNSLQIRIPQKLGSHVEYGLYNAEKSERSMYSL